jgi:hypothetical protein
MTEGHWTVKPALGHFAQGYPLLTQIGQRPGSGGPEVDGGPVSGSGQMSGIGPNAARETQRALAAIDSGLQKAVIVAPILRPDRATGPPPAFEANVLEAEAKRRHEGPNLVKTAETERASNPREAEVQRRAVAPTAYPGKDSAPRASLDLTV